MVRNRTPIPIPITYEIYVVNPEGWQIAGDDPTSFMEGGRRIPVKWEGPYVRVLSGPRHILTTVSDLNDNAKKETR